uniref:Putative secreted protein n=1 Tax=Ixodes ricinus TaxID=34613 RepID=A0A6B0UE46_IXORI
MHVFLFFRALEVVCVAVLSVCSLHCTKVFSFMVKMFPRVERSLAAAAKSKPQRKQSWNNLLLRFGDCMLSCFAIVETVCARC